MRRTLFIPLLLVVFAGCASNPYATFYHPNIVSIETRLRFLPLQAMPEITSIRDEDFKDSIANMKAHGWVCVGSSDFNIPFGLPPGKALLEQARRVEVDRILLVSKFIYLEKGVAPIVNYQPSQTYTTTHNGTYYGNGNVGTFSGTSTTTTPGTLQTEYVPYQRPVYEVGASFWRQTR